MPVTNKQFANAPASLQDFPNGLRQVDTPCTCRDHELEGHVPAARYKHDIVLVPHEHSTRSSQRPQEPVDGKRYEALDLVSATVCHVLNLSKFTEAMSVTQRAALQSWHDLDRGVL